MLGIASGIFAQSYWPWREDILRYIKSQLNREKRVHIVPDKTRPRQTHVGRSNVIDPINNHIELSNDLSSDSLGASPDQPYPFEH